jgi:hypothetical protein
VLHSVCFGWLISRSFAGDLTPIATTAARVADGRAGALVSLPENGPGSIQALRDVSGMIPPPGNPGTVASVNTGILCPAKRTVPGGLCRIYGQRVPCRGRYLAVRCLA